MLTDIILIVAAYGLGSVSTAILVCRAMGLADPRTEGSRNPGATNVLRIGGKKAAALTLAGDFAKGLLPVLVARALESSTETLALVGGAAFLGHLFPVFFGFRGGKGVATGAGVLFGFSWPLGLAVATTWLIVAKVLRVSSLAALMATALAPVFAWALGEARPILFAVLFLCVLVLWRHRSNIQRLLSGDEGKIGQPPS